MNLDVVAGRRYPVDAIDRNEIRAGSIAYQDLLDRLRPPRNGAQNAAHALLEISVFGIRQCGLDALDAAQKPLAVVGLEQIVERLHVECLNGVLRVGGGEYDVRGFGAANGLEYIEAAVRTQLDVEID